HDGGGAIRGVAVDYGDPVLAAAPSGGGDIAPFDDGEFAAKSGSGGSGGGGGGSGVVATYYSGSANGTAGYDIQIDFKGSGWTADLEAAFQQTADYYTTVITDDIGGGGLYRGK